MDDDILHRRMNKKFALYQICENILSSVKARIRFAMSCSVHEIKFSFCTVNTYGCPILTFNDNNKVKEYVIKKLTEQGFRVYDVYYLQDGIEWSIVIRW